MDYVASGGSSGSSEGEGELRDGAEERKRKYRLLLGKGSSDEGESEGSVEESVGLLGRKNAVKGAREEEEDNIFGGKTFRRGKLLERIIRLFFLYRRTGACCRIRRTR